MFEKREWMERVKDMQINEKEVLINNFNSSIKKRKRKKNVLEYCIEKREDRFEV